MHAQLRQTRLSCSSTVYQRPSRRLAHVSRPAAIAPAPGCAATTDLDVAVVGGGPAGLAAAHALSVAMPSLRIAVFERVPKLMKRGAGFEFDVNGQKALYAIKPELFTAAEACGKPASRNKMYDPQGNMFKMEDNQALMATFKKKYGYSAFMVAWADLQRLLAESLPANVPLHLGRRLERYEEAEDGTLRLHLTGQDSPITTSLLVAADGYFSRVRDVCLGDGPPTWAGTAIWRAVVDEQLAVDCGATDGSGLWYTGDFLNCMIFLVGGRQAVWVAFAPEAKLIEAGIDFLALQKTRAHISSAQADSYQERANELGKAAKERCLKVYDKFPAVLKHMIQTTDDATVLEHGIFTRSPKDMTPDSFGRRRVVLIGDAAHPMRPAGQGVNQAMEDAYQLGRAVAEAGGITDAALDGFRSSRTKRIVPVIIQSERQGRASYQKEAELAVEGSIPPDEYLDYCYGIELEPLSGMMSATKANAAH